MRLRDDPERGAATVLAAGLLLMVSVLALACVDVLRAVHARDRAQVAADASALAAAQELAVAGTRPPAEVAAEYAARNGAIAVYCVCAPGSREAVVGVEVTAAMVFLGPDRPIRARARAVIGGA